jgi:hypothetical protein
LPAPTKTRRPEKSRKSGSELWFTFGGWPSEDMLETYASPTVSNIAESIASRAVLPAQITN